MSLIGFVLNSLMTSGHHAVTAILVGVVSCLLYSIIKVNLKRRHLPPGPNPIPLIGNLLLFKAKHFHENMKDTVKELGIKTGIFTIFFGSSPQIVLTSPQLCLEMLKRHEFAGRPQLNLFKLEKPPNSVDVIFSDFNKEWETLRKVTHSAVRKYAVSDRLPLVVANVVDEVVATIKEKSGIGQEFDIVKYLHVMLYSILASSAFSKRYKLDDDILLKYIDAFEAAEKNDRQLFVATTIPFGQFIFRSVMKQFFEAKQFQWDFVKNQYEEHLSTFDEKNVRDFTDALLMAKKEAEEEGDNKKETVKHLKPLNIQNVMTDLFVAGSETTKNVLSWAFLLMANYPETQRKIREEIYSVLDVDEVANLGHRELCNYTTAFIAEVLRFRYVVPGGVPHKATVDTEIAGYKIDKDTDIFATMGLMFQDKNIWKDPEVLKPERFLAESGKFVSKPNEFYIPFSAGRRSCLGAKLALADLFFIITRFIQKTKGYEFVLLDGPGSANLDGDVKKTTGWIPHDYTIILSHADY